MFCLQQHVFKLTKAGIFSELLPASHRRPCCDIAAHMFQELTLPCATWALPTNPRLCLGTEHRLGEKSAPNCQSFLAIAADALDILFPVFHPKISFQASNFSTHRFWNENFARALLCSILEQIKQLWNTILNLYQLKIKSKYSTQIFPSIPKNKIPSQSPAVKDRSAARFQEPDSFSSGSKHLHRAMETQPRCQCLPPSHKEHPHHQR